jgi:hypothetical protein
MNRITASSRISDQSVYRNGTVVFENRGAGLPDFLLSIYQHIGANYPKFYKMDNLSKLGWLAAEVLLKDFPSKNFQPEEVGIALANANSSLDVDIKYYETVKEIASPALFVYTLPNIMIGEICIRNNFKGESSFFISPEFDADFMERMVNDLLDNEVLKACICGWVDLLGDEYKAVLYRVEKEMGPGTDGSASGNGGDLDFTKENIHKIFQAENG